ncbi:MAG: helix-turn-helix transcriptional regulator [Lachnospiraceae bacterium]|nr:helix-turn-helix transcriptional regulator [Lachnospiraceae bacterium]
MNSGSIDIKKLGVNIKTARELAKLSQSDVARYLDVDQSLISKIESGERTISAESLERLARFFCIPVNELLYAESINLEGKVAFRTDNLTFEDNCILADVNSIILNQLEMDGFLHGKN